MKVMFEMLHAAHLIDTRCDFEETGDVVESTLTP